MVNPKLVSRPGLQSAADRSCRPLTGSQSPRRLSITATKTMIYVSFSTCDRSEVHAHKLGLLLAVGSLDVGGA